MGSESRVERKKGRSSGGIKRGGNCGWCLDVEDDTTEWCGWSSDWGSPKAVVLKMVETIGA
jgi:hypothetical protein